MMKTRILLVLLSAATLAAPIFSEIAHAQKDDDFQRSWRGVATLKTLAKKDKRRDISVIYPIFSGHRAVAQVAGLKLKRDAIGGYNGFVKESREPDADWKNDAPEYELDSVPTLVANLPHFISVIVMDWQYTGGAHGFGGTSGYNFGVPAGASRPRQLKLADFFTDGAASSRRINDLLMAKLRATKGTEQEALWVLDGSVKWVSKMSRENFVAEKDGLHWFFSPYEMAPYAAGEFEVKLSPRELGPKYRASLLR